MRFEFSWAVNSMLILVYAPYNGSIIECFGGKFCSLLQGKFCTDNEGRMFLRNVT
jgi:hypothetical protein